MGYFFGLRWGSITVSGTTYVVEQILFFIVPSILTLDFDLILGSVLAFGGPNGLFLGSARWSTHVVEELSFSLFLSILTFDFD